MGHSLGGVIGSQYVSKHSDKMKGLILLGSYPNRNLSKTSIKLLSIYGSEDKVLNMGDYHSAKENWPKDSKMEMEKLVSLMNSKLKRQ